MSFEGPYTEKDNTSLENTEAIKDYKDILDAEGSVLRDLFEHITQGGKLIDKNYTLLGRQWWPKEQYREAGENIISRSLPDNELYNIANIVGVSFWEDLSLLNIDERINILKQANLNHKLASFREQLNIDAHERGAKLKIYKQEVLDYLSREQREVGVLEIQALINDKEDRDFIFTDVVLIDLENEDKVIVSGYGNKRTCSFNDPKNEKLINVAEQKILEIIKGNQRTYFPFRGRYILTSELEEQIKEMPFWRSALDRLLSSRKIGVDGKYHKGEKTKSFYKIVE